jgi:hypothetical protein
MHLKATLTFPTPPVHDDETQRKIMSLVRLLWTVHPRGVTVVMNDTNSVTINLAFVQAAAFRDNPVADLRMALHGRFPGIEVQVEQVPEAETAPATA